MEAIINMIPSEKQQAKNTISRIHRFIKILKTQATSITLHPISNSNEYIFRFYKGIIRTKWDVNALGYGDYAKYKSIIHSLNIPITICKE